MFDAFEKVFESKLSGNKTRKQTFDEATEEYRKEFGFQPYIDHDSFKSSRSRRKKKK
jgi:hypothetical protein